MSYETVKKRLKIFVKKGPFKPLCHFNYYFHCFDEKKNKLSICNKNESTCICRFD